VRTRTTVSQAHTSQWLGSFANPGNGLYREELRRVVAVIQLYSKAHDLPEGQVVLRLDGQYGMGAVLGDLAGFCYVMRGKDYRVLDLPQVQSRLYLWKIQQFTRPESDLVRTLYDCPEVPVGPHGQRCRVVVATHPADARKSKVGLSRSGLVYELFFTRLPQSAFTAADVVALYLLSFAFEPLLSDEDQEQDPDRWCSHSAAGKPAWQIISQWGCFLRLECGHQLEPTPLRTTEFASPSPEASEGEAAPSGFACPEAGLPWKAGRFSGRDFVPQADGTLRVLFCARIRDCRDCHLREQCQWHGTTTKKPRRVSVLLRPLGIGAAPVPWKDWSRRHDRQVALQLCRSQRVEVQMEQTSQAAPATSPVILSRAQRAHARLSWDERLARNARPPEAARVKIKPFGIPAGFAASFGLVTA
jgi:hypothetical protein